MATINDNGQAQDGATIVPTAPAAATNQAIGGNAVIPSVPTPSTAIDVSTLGSAPIVKLPAVPSPYTYDIAHLPSIDTLINPAPTQTQQEQDALGAKLATDTAKLGTKAAAQTAAEDSAAKALGATNGLSDFTTRLTDINSQIQALQKENAAIPLQLQEDATGRGITTSALEPIQAGLLRKNSIKALGLSAIAQTLQGNIASAKATAERAVEVEFSPIQAEIDYLKTALDLNKDKLSREDSQRAAALQVQLSERQRLLNQQKEDKTTILGWAAEAAKNGASTLTINQALSLNDPNEALKVLGSYLSDPVAKEKALVDLQNARKQGQLTDAQIAKTYAEANPANKPATQAQQTTAGYASRLVQANDIINGLQGKFASANPAAFAIGGVVPSFLQSSDRQSYEQAKKNFVNAVLRQESGAVISDQEFKNAEQQYFPQPGDTAQTIAQKQANRELVIRNFINASGNAYEAPPQAATAGTDLAAYRSQLQPGEVLVRNKRTGEIGALTKQEASQQAYLYEQI